VTARNADKGRAAVAGIVQRLGGHAQVQLVVFDLADLTSVRRGADEILEQAPRLDVLVNNAGVVLSERHETVDGFEATFATNHLGPFLLTNLLLDRIRESAPSRIVNVASTAHNTARKGIPFDDLQSSKKRYRGMRVYGESKLANILFTVELARRLAGTGVTANSLHPGTVRTGYGADGDARGFLAFGIKIAKPFFLSPAKGARTSIYLASSPAVEGVTGEYFDKCKPAKSRRWAQDAEAAQRLWKVSEELVGLAAPAQG
jgi:NAD(P)-dependent dehydrogenase (short-subunit alcohol dehydrogenase family)